MAIAPFQAFEDFLEENPVDNQSSRIYVKSRPVLGPQGPAGPPGPASGGMKNVRAYGAIGDGITDDTVAINLAIAAVAATGGIVSFPPGGYRITETLNMLPGVSLQGSTRLSSFLMAGANDLKLVSYSAEALVNGFEIRNLGFFAGAHTDVTGIYLDGVDSEKRLSIVHLADLLFNCRTAVYLRFCANVTLDNCFANACTDGFRLNNVADATLHNCQAQNGTGYGFLIEGGPGAFDEGVKLIACTTNGQAYGLTVIGQDWGQVVGCSFTTCTGAPMTFASATAWRISTTDIASAYGGAGLVTDAGCSNFQISTCFVALNSFGMALYGSKINVNGCNFEANSSVDIFLLATTSAVAANICNSTGHVSSILEAAPGNFNVVTGNTTNGTVDLSGANSSATGNVVF